MRRPPGDGACGARAKYWPHTGNAASPSAVIDAVRAARRRPRVAPGVDHDGDQAQLAVGGANKAERTRDTHSCWRWRWRSRIRGGDLEPPPGGSGDCADLGGDFCEILILAEYRSDVELAGAGHADEVEGKAEVDAFLAGNKTRTRWEEPSWAAMVSGWYRRGRDVTWMLARRMAMRRRVQ